MLMLVRLQLFSLILIGFTGLGAFAAQSVPQTFTLDGRLYADTAALTPLVDTGVLTFQILDKNQTCILYEETQNFDTRSSNGYFTAQVGSTTTAPSNAKRTANDSTHSMASIFSNTGGIITGKLLSNTASACNYTPTAADTRYVRIVMTPAGDNTPRVLSPNLALDSVPHSIAAESSDTLQGIDANGFLKVNTLAPANLSQANLENIFSILNYPKLTDLLSGTSAAYVQASSNGTAKIPTVSGTPATPSAGQIWYDAGVLKYWDANSSSVQTLGTSSGSTDLTSSVSGVLPVANGGTGTATGSITGTGALNFAAGGANSNVSLTPSGTGYSLLNGNVGIGTATPATTLHVVGTTRFDGISSSFSYRATDGGNGRVTFGSNNSIGNISLLNSSGTNTITLYNAGDNRLVGRNNADFSFYTNNIEKMRITAGGNVGIGTDAPNHILEAAGASTAPSLSANNGTFQLNMSSTTALEMGSNPATPYALWMQTKRSSNDGTSWPLVLNPLGGNVGIGTSAPATTLEVVGGGRFYSTGANTTLNVGRAGDAIYYNALNVYSGYNATNPSVQLSQDFQGAAVRSYLGSMRFEVGSTPLEAVRISNTGNVGIGTTAPLTNLHVKGNELVDGSLYIGAALPGTGINVTRLNLSKLEFNASPAGYPGPFSVGAAGMTSTASGGNLSVYAQDAYGTGAYNGGDLILSAGKKGSAGIDGSVQLRTGTTEWMRITNTGNVGIGTTTPASTLTVNGTGNTGSIQLSGSLSITGFQVDGTYPWGGNHFATNFTPTLSAGVNNSMGAVAVLPQISNTTTGSIIGLKIGDLTTSNASTAANYYGLYIKTPTGASSNYAIYSEGGNSFFGGNVGIGTTVPAYTLDVTGTMRVTGQAYTTTGNGSFTILSDARYKDVHGPYQSGLADLLKVNTIRYNYVADNPLHSDPTQEYVGVTAQNLQRAIPEAVHEKDGYLTVNTSPVLWTLVNGIKELYAKFVEQSREIASLKNDNENLRQENALKEKELQAIKDRLDSIEKNLKLVP